MTMTPIARVAAYAALAQQRGVDLIDALPDAGDPPGRVELHVSDLAAVLAALADACDDHETCEQCGTALCVTCGVGEAADCPADTVHCTSPWCFDQACMDAHRDDVAADIAADIALEACEQDTPDYDHSNT